MDITKKLFLVLFSMSAAVGVSWLFTQRIERIRVKPLLPEEEEDPKDRKKRLRREAELRRRRRQSMRSSPFRRRNRRLEQEQLSGSSDHDAHSEGERGDTADRATGGRPRSASDLSSPLRARRRTPRKLRRASSLAQRGGAGREGARATSRRSLFTYMPSPDKSHRSKARAAKAAAAAPPQNKKEERDALRLERAQSLPLRISNEEDVPNLNSHAFYSFLRVYDQGGIKNLRSPRSSSIAEESDPLDDDDIGCDDD